MPVAPVSGPSPAAKGGGIRVPHGVRPRCPRVSSRLGDATTPRGPADPAARPPPARWLETFSNVPASRSSADRGVLWAGVEPATARL